MNPNLEFFKGKKVFVTGHTGFKGAWLCWILIKLGASVTGFALPAPTKPSLFVLSRLQDHLNSVIGDVRNIEQLRRAFVLANPDVVIHLAAQPLVKEGYLNPLQTFETNVMGTVNILECLRASDHVQSFLNVTTDKVYLNREWLWGYRETDRLDGYDPYSNSKSCSDLITNCYRRSFFAQKDIPLSVARAGNVIGGGDFAENRIIPDCVRSAVKKQRMVIRNPHSVRPYQHVLEALFAYLEIIVKQEKDKELEGCYNIGPEPEDCVSTLYLVKQFAKAWPTKFEYEISTQKNSIHEASFLKLDSTKMKTLIGWHPKWNIGIAIEKTVEWTLAWKEGRTVTKVMDSQISAYLAKKREVQ